MRRYPAYRESGVEWLGEVPVSWEVSVLKRVASIKYGIGEPPAYREVGTPLIRATNVNAGIISSEGMVFVDPLDVPASRRVWLALGDIVVVRSGAYTGDSALVREENIPAIAGFDMVVTPSAADPSFLQYALLSTEVKAFQLDLLQARAAQPHLNAQELGGCLLPLPPLPEQRAIAAFLDRETAKIDALVAEQRRLIALLAEKRQAVISHAVTRGLNPDARLKPSGIDWLGDVPEGWEVVPLKHLTAPGRDIMYGIVLPGPNVEEGVPIVKGGDVKSHRLRLELLNRTTPEIEAPFARARLRPRDIVYSIRGTIGDAELVPQDLENANITQDVARVSPDTGVDPDWLLFVLKSKPIFAQLEPRSLGAAVRGINIFDLKRARAQTELIESRGFP